ncbi:integrase [Streptomyces sp. NPDC005890]|uniref:tyrosine-type recombinase/integrase n=1 Tax=Streptomyces sp. NPDC005890 TaxID=3154568 RepID=UPI0033ECEFBE
MGSGAGAEFGCGGFDAEVQEPAQAFQYGQDKLYEIRHGTHISNRDGATLMTEWIDDWLTALEVAHTTELSYRSVIENHIRPYFAKRNTAVADIDVIAYRAFRKSARQALPGSWANAMKVLNLLIDDAVPQLIKVSPVERTRRRGKFTKRPKERKKDMLPEAVEQLAYNAEVLLGFQGYVLIWTMAMTGMRPTELYGLTRGYCYPNWPASDPRPDEDEKERYEEDLERYGKGGERMPAIRVQRQVQYVDGELTFLPPKYESYRTLVIPDFLADLLEQLLGSHDSPWVFPAIRGGCLGGMNVRYRYWPRISGGADAHEGPLVRKPRPVLPKVPSFAGRRMYLLRHGHKAWLDEDHGREVYAVEARMGHEVPGVRGTYSSVTMAMEQAIRQTLQERWERLQANPGSEA